MAMKSDKLLCYMLSAILALTAQTLLNTVILKVLEQLTNENEDIQLKYEH